ncbi:MAG: bifunctional oligoribonuclease/PAP phosphatase NrnA [Phycisphaerae bacterium]|nr:bifunctional oligoribonuclease/PAP phosphatase NrnA [Phycisphaerae bacterium]
MSELYQQLIDRISDRQHVLVTTHVRPDGDALGTTAALVLALRKIGIPAEVLLLSHLPSKYAFIYKDNAIKFHDAEKGWPATLTLNQFDALLVADTGTWSQLPGLKEKLEALNGPRLVIDHHLTQESWADVRVVDTRAAAAAEIVGHLLERWDIALDRPIATAIFLGLASDTGWFQYSSTRPETMRLAARLMEAGVDTDAMYQHLYQNERPQRLLLQTRALQSLELQSSNRLAVMHLTTADFAACGAEVPSTEGIINGPLGIADVQVSILLLEPTEPRLDGPIRISLRSKGQVDCARFCEKFGGGGHARAAGMRLPGPLADAKRIVMDAMLRTLSVPLLTPSRGASEPG